MELAHLKALAGPVCLQAYQLATSKKGRAAITLAVGALAIETLLTQKTPPSKSVVAFVALGCVDLISSFREGVSISTSLDKAAQQDAILEKRISDLEKVNKQLIWINRAFGFLAAQKAKVTKELSDQLAQAEKLEPIATSLAASIAKMAQAIAQMKALVAEHKAETEIQRTLLERNTTLLALLTEEMDSNSPVLLARLKELMTPPKSPGLFTRFMGVITSKGAK